MSPRRPFLTLVLIAIAAIGSLPAAPASAASLPAGSTAILSGAPSLFDALPAPVGYARGESEVVSQNGRYVAFTSTSDGLVDGDDDRVINVYVKDRATGAVTHVSKRTGAAGEPSHRDCDEPAMSDDGTRVAFTCAGPLDDADDNGGRDVYVRDLPSATTILVSRAGNLGAVSDRGADEATISATGEYVAFSSDGQNLTPDSDGTGQSVYRRRIGGTNEVVIVSRRDAANGNTVFGGKEASISDDGQKVAFTSFPAYPEADPADTNDHSDVFVRDVPSSKLILASRAPLAGAAGNDHSDSPALAGNGEAVAFVSKATNLDTTYDNTDGEPDVYWRPLTGTTNQQNTALVSINAASEKSNATEPTIDDSGNRVGFLAEDPLDPADTNSSVDAYVKDVSVANTLSLISRADGDAGAVGKVDASTVSVSGDGTKVAASIDDGRLTPGVDPRSGNVILRDLSATPKRTTAIGRPAGDAPFVNEGGSSYGAALSADGRFAAFVTSSPGLGLPDGARRGVVVRDRVTGSVTYASRADGPDGAPLPESGSIPAISADGRRVAFAVIGDVPERGVWVRDIVENRTYLASRADGPNGAPGNGNSNGPSLDADGSRVSFASAATNLGDGDTDAGQDVHVRDLETGQTLLASRADGLNGPDGNGQSQSADLSGDGFRAVFASTATNLGDGDTNVQSDVHVRDLSAQTTRLVSANANGAPGNGPSFQPTIDQSGARVAFVSTATDLGTTEPGAKAFVRDLGAGTVSLASRADGADGAPANPGVQNAIISPDGGYVAFTSIASNLEPGVPPNVPQAYRRDLAAQDTELVSRGPDGQPAKIHSSASDISQGGACVSFRAVDAFHGPQLDFVQEYLRVFRADCAAGDEAPGGPGAGGDGGAGGAGGGAGPDADRIAPVLSRAKLSRKRFRVGRAATPRAAAAKRGTVLSFRSTEAASLSIKLERAAGKKRRYRRAGTLTRRIRAGNGKVALSGRLGKRRMAAGTYRATLVATDAAGNRSKPVRVKFTIEKG